LTRKDKLKKKWDAFKKISVKKKKITVKKEEDSLRLTQNISSKKYVNIV
jgi:hypothetical protein